VIEFRESLETGLDSLRARALRSFLAMLGIIFGVGAVIAMLSIGAGAEREALAIIDAMGMRNVIVRAEEPETEAERQELRRQSPGLAERDARALSEAVPGVERVVAKVEVQTWNVRAREGRSRPRVIGVSHNYPELVPVRLSEGRFLDARDEATFGQVCVIGPGVRRELFGFGPALGRPLKVNDQWLTVVGVLAPGEGPREIQGVDVRGTNEDLLLPVTTAQRKFSRDPLASPLDELVVRLRPGTPVTESAAVVGTLLDRLHGGASDYSITVPEELLEQSQKTQRLFDVVMGAIAGISLLVGGIGIMNVMLATVLERTREIGIRRAVGARRADIRDQFVVEAFTVTAIGGILGIAMGLAIAQGVAWFAGWTTIVTLPSILLAVGVSAGVGLVFGIYPALRAASLDPIESLHYE
jgi:putative ABC transport system permease protein